MRHVAGADYSIPAEPRELLRADEMLRANPPTTRWRCDQRAIWGRSRRFDRGSADGRYRRNFALRDASIDLPHLPLTGHAGNRCILRDGGSFGAHHLLPNQATHTAMA